LNIDKSGFCLKLGEAWSAELTPCRNSWDPSGTNNPLTESLICLPSRYWVITTPWDRGHRPLKSQFPEARRRPPMTPRRIGSSGTAEPQPVVPLYSAWFLGRSGDWDRSGGAAQLVRGGPVRPPPFSLPRVCGGRGGMFPAPDGPIADLLAMIGISARGTTRLSDLSASLLLIREGRFFRV